MSDNDKIREGEFRSWSFPPEKIREWTRVFLSDAGYELLPPDYIGFVLPAIYGRRKEGEKTYDIVGFDAPDMETSTEALAKLAAARAVLGDRADYVLVLPPVSEYLMLEFFRAEKGRWYFEMKRNKFMLWLSNPDEEFTWCIVGGPQDRLFEEYFALGKMPLDPVLAMQLSREAWEEEE